ncbi:protein jagunal-like isoform X3 [Euwallacea fornicatus]|uniref:protein jagunal-like isoform X3 n=1 Tax=Euwallacea fornicatus TaxID=995702 RepID=UPI00338D5A7A
MSTVPLENLRRETATRSPSMECLDEADDVSTQNIHAQDRLSAPPKTMLKYCIFFHYMFSLAMLVKLTPYILKQFNISIVPVEELEVPDPLTWELVWLPSVLSSTLALHSMRKNSYVLMRYYMTGIVLLGFLPLLNGILEWLPEVIMYVFAENFIDFYDIFFWMDLPCGLLWYGFIFLAANVHSFSLYFGYKLLCDWRLSSNHMD